MKKTAFELIFRWPKIDYSSVTGFCCCKRPPLTTGVDRKVGVSVKIVGTVLQKSYVKSIKSVFFSMASCHIVVTTAGDL